MRFMTRLVPLTFVGALALSLVGTQAAHAQFGDCTHPAVSQPFLSFGDENFYALAPYGTFDNLAVSDWTLSNGARVISTVQPNGKTGSVLDLSSGAAATTPSLCITSDYPTARLWSRDVTGADGVTFSVSYLQDGVWTKQKETGQLHGSKNGWQLSAPMNLKSEKKTGWQQIRVTFTARGKTSRSQLDDVWIDPRASR